LGALFDVKYALIVLGHLWHGLRWGVWSADGVARGHVNGISMAGGKEPMLDFVSEWWSFGENEE